jgi:hypothetical protein
MCLRRSKRINTYLFLPCSRYKPLYLDLQGLYQQRDPIPRVYLSDFRYLPHDITAPIPFNRLCDVLQVLQDSGLSRVIT